MKKKLLALAVGISIIQISQAQISKGSKLIGGTLQFSTTTDDRPNGTGPDTKNNFWALSPHFGKAVKNNRVVGIFLNIGGNRYDYQYTQVTYARQKTSSYGGGFFYQPYFPISSKFLLSANTSLGVTFGKEDRSEIISNSTRQFQKSSLFRSNLTLTPGLTYVASKRVLLEMYLSQLLSLQYEQRKVTDIPPSQTSTYTITTKSFFGSMNTNPFNSLGIGLRFILP